MAELPEEFRLTPEMRAMHTHLFTTVGKRKTGYANFALLHVDDVAELFWCLPCESSEFVCTTRNPEKARQPIVRCEKCKRRWRIRDWTGTATRKLIHVEARGHG